MNHATQQWSVLFSNFERCSKKIMIIYRVAVGWFAYRPSEMNEAILCWSMQSKCEYINHDHKPMRCTFDDVIFDSKLSVPTRFECVFFICIFIRMQNKFFNEKKKNECRQSTYAIALVNDLFVSLVAFAFIFVAFSLFLFANVWGLYSDERFKRESILLFVPPPSKFKRIQHRIWNLLEKWTCGVVDWWFSSIRTCFSFSIFRSQFGFELMRSTAIIDRSKIDENRL